MRREVPFRLSTAGDDVCLAVRDDQWRVYLKGARRIGCDWFVQILALGPRACTFTIRVASLPYEAATARRILELVSDCLHADVLRPHMYLELSGKVH
jgi:hypothetical protein